MATAGDAEVLLPLRERTELVCRRNSTERALADWRGDSQIGCSTAEGDDERAALLADRQVRRAARIR